MRLFLKKNLHFWLVHKYPINEIKLIVKVHEAEKAWDWKYINMISNQLILEFGECGSSCETR